MKELILDGIPIAVTKKSIKNMYIRILPPDGEVRISAPYRVSDKAIRGFALDKLAWIKKQRERFMQRVILMQPQYVSGEECELWGKRYRLRVEDGCGAVNVSLSGDEILLQIRQGNSREQRGHALNEWYRRKMQEVLPELLTRCEAIVGVRAQECRIKNMRTKWGSCNINKKCIWLNLQLVKKEPDCLEYVMIHELVHLLERNHNARFYGFMDRFYPDWRAVRARLNSK